MPIAEKKKVYALTHALESDVSNFVVRALDGFTSPLNAKQTKAAHFWFEKHEQTSAIGQPWQNLFKYLSLSDKLLVVNNHIAILGKHFCITEKRMQEFAHALAKLIDPRNGVAHGGIWKEEYYDVAITEASYIYTDYPELDLAEFRQEWKLIRHPDYVEQIIIPEYWRAEASISNNLPQPVDDKIGFVGRERDRKQLMGMLDGVHPVISVVAAGGVGKTALVLECLRELVRPESKFALNSKFERVHWISLKTTRFGLDEVIIIRDALRTPLQMLDTLRVDLNDAFATAEAALSPEENKTPPLTLQSTPPSVTPLDEPSIREQIEKTTQELLRILQERRILLVIDNLETIDWSQVRPLLRINSGNSKILVTSRLALNEGDLPYHLEKMEPQDAMLLMRKSLQQINVDEDRSDETLMEICKKLFFNPLAIRWFAQGRARDESIDKLLRIGGQLDKVLEFCFDTAYQSLDERHREYLKIFVSIDKPLSEVQIALLLKNDDIAQVNSDLKHLSRSSFVRRSVDDWARGRSDLWAMDDAARRFLLSQGESADPEENRRLQAENQRLNSLRDTANSYYQQYGGFHSKSFNPLTTDEAMVVHVLEKASQALIDARQAKGDERREFLEKALDSVQRAEKLLPGYYDVWRVSAQVQAARGVHDQAIENFEKALQLAGDRNEPVIYHYARYLIKDNPRSVVSLLAGLNEDASPYLLDLVARAQYGLNLHPEALITFEHLKARYEVLKVSERLEILTRYIICLRAVTHGQNTTEPQKSEYLRMVFELALEAFNMTDSLPPALRKNVRMCVQEACFLMAVERTENNCPISWFIFKPLWQQLKNSSLRLVGDQTDGLAALQKAHPAISAEMEEFFYEREETLHLSEDIAVRSQMSGSVEKIRRGPTGFKQYGFIVSDDGSKFFFHRSSVFGINDSKEWKELCQQSYAGLRVKFTPGHPSEEGKLPEAYAIYVVL